MTDKLQVHRSADRFTTVGDGTASRHLLSFGAHYEPSQVAIGPLIAYNDELVEPGAGFDEHHHRDVEIVTWVVSGRLRHHDSTGRSGDITAGMAQRLTAGSGVVHSEVNAATARGRGEPVRFIQMWLRPDEPGGRPSYADRPLDTGALRDGFVVVASGDPRFRDYAAVTLGQSHATLFASRLSSGITRLLPAAGALHLFVVVGQVSLSLSDELGEGDSAMVPSNPDQPVTLTAMMDSEVLVWSLAQPAAPSSL